NEAGDGLQQRRLAGPVRAEQGQGLAPGDGEVHVEEHLEPAVGDRHALDVEQGLAHSSLRWGVPSPPARFQHVQAFRHTTSRSKSTAWCLPGPSEPSRLPGIPTVPSCSAAATKPPWVSWGPAFWAAATNRSNT